MITYDKFVEKCVKRSLAHQSPWECISIYFPHSITKDEIIKLFKNFQPAIYEDNYSQNPSKFIFKKNGVEVKVLKKSLQIFHQFKNENPKNIISAADKMLIEIWKILDIYWNQKYKRKWKFTLDMETEIAERELSGK